MSEPPKSSASQLARRVTAFTAACVLISNMVGSGIFGSTGFMAGDIGNTWIILALWAAGGLYAILGGLCYSELGTAMPKAGGEYVYLRRTYGPIWGFLSGWTSFTIGFSAAVASAAYLFANHFQQLLFPQGTPTDGPLAILFHAKIIGLVFVWSLTLVHLRGVSTGGFVQQLLTVIKVGAILLLVGAGFASSRGSWSNLTPTAETPFTFNTMLVSFMFVTFTYSGWNAAGYIAGEIARPHRSIPQATILGAFCVTLMYLAINLVYFYSMPLSELASEPVAPVAQKSAVALFGSAWGGAMTAFLCISILGAASAMVWAGPRVYYAMAADGVFPRLFSRLGRRSGAPVHAIILQSLWISVLLVLAGGFEELVLYASFVLIVFTALAVAAVIVLRLREPHLSRPFRVPGYPAVPVLFLVISLAVMWAALTYMPVKSLLGLATVAAGIPFYFVWTRRREIATAPDESGDSINNPSDRRE